MTGGTGRGGTLLRLRAADWFGLKRLAAVLLSTCVPVGILRSLPPSVRQRLPVPADLTEYVMYSGERVLLVAPGRDQVAKSIFWGGGRPLSPNDRQVLFTFERLVSDVDVFVDCGAYSGLFALVAAKANPQVRALAFELLPENARLASSNVGANGLCARVEVFQMALSDSSGDILVPTDCGTVSHPSGLSLDSRFTTGRRVPIATIDSLGLGGKLMIKLDVEGFELNVMRGGIETIEALRPDMICEFLEGTGTDGPATALLKELGYMFYEITGRGLVEREEIVADPNSRDWLLTARARPDIEAHLA